MNHPRIRGLAGAALCLTLGGCVDIDTDRRGTYCNEGDQRPCYDGAPATAGVGPCHAGKETCVGGAWAACAGQVVPRSERCKTPVDEDCDGRSLDLEDGCVCEPGVSGACYEGPAATLGVGACQSGTGTCNPQGTGFEVCDGQVLPAAEQCDTGAEDESCDGIATCSGAPYWGLRYGDGATQVGSGVTTDARGNVILTGAFEGTVRFGGGERVSAGGLDIYVVKVDAEGEYFWSKRFGAEGIDEGHAVTTDAERNALLTGSCSGAVDFGNGASGSTSADDVYVVKLGTSGQHLWSKRAGAEGVQTGAAIAFARAADETLPEGAPGEHGYVLVTGSFEGELDFGCGPLVADGTDVFVAKLDDATGACGWSKGFGGAGDQQGTGIAVDSMGNVVLVGAFGGTAQLGSITLSGDGLSDIFVAKLDPGGEPLWSKAFADVAMIPSEQAVKGVAVDTHDNVVVTGEMSGSVDFGGGPLEGGGPSIFVAKLDPGGAHLWSKRFAGAPASGGTAIAADGADNVLLTGYFEGSVDFGKGALIAALGGTADAFTAKLGPGGEPFWSRRFGDAAAQRGRGIAVDGRGNIAFTGETEGDIDFGGGGLTTAGGKDAFLGKLLP